MSLAQRLLKGIMVPLLVLPTVTVAGITNTSNEFQVEAYQVVKEPQSCNSTLIVQVRNNSSAPTNSGLFLHAEQYRSLGGTLRQSTMLGGQRVPVIAPGQTAEVRYTFIRERDKNLAGFRFKIVAATVGMADGPLPPVSETYSATIATQELDRTANRFRCSVSNTGSMPVPKPTVQLYTATQGAPTTLAPAGGGMVTTCLMPGTTAQYDKPVMDGASIVSYRIHLVADGQTLDDRTIGQTPTIKPGVTRLKPELKTRPLIQRPQ